MNVNFTPEQEAQLAQIAAKAGADAEQLMRDAALRLLEQKTPLPAAAPELPVWDLGAIGSLHRRDLYDDAR